MLSSALHSSGQVDGFFVVEGQEPGHFQGFAVVLLRGDHAAARAACQVNHVIGGQAQDCCRTSRT